MQNANKVNAIHLQSLNFMKSQFVNFTKLTTRLSRASVEVRGRVQFISTLLLVNIVLMNGASLTSFYSVGLGGRTGLRLGAEGHITLTTQA